MRLMGLGGLHALSMKPAKQWSCSGSAMKMHDDDELLACEVHFDQGAPYI